eukprot:TRINITY_DN10368_c0_g1_i5.p2 TRINITY_DN10368_c0_g1~~TRINITY_DN10368_c0_g1_i5.p2  ORF type:complete len:124 (-),score=26.61 TRINITY_DN10368_c0_g1_i5:786-1157(-)
MLSNILPLTLHLYYKRMELDADKVSEMLEDVLDTENKIKGTHTIPVDCATYLGLFREHAEQVTEIWKESFFSGKLHVTQGTSSKKLVLLYVADEIIQKTRSRGFDYVRTFGETLELAINALIE